MSGPREIYIYIKKNPDHLFYVKPLSFYVKAGADDGQLQEACIDKNDEGHCADIRYVCVPV